MRGMDLGGVWRELRPRRAPDNNGRDHETGARLEIVEQPDDTLAVELEPDLLFDLAEGGFGDAFAVVGAPAGERPLTRVAPKRQRSPRQDERRIAAVVSDQRDGYGGSSEGVVDDGPSLESADALAYPFPELLVECDAGHREHYRCGLDASRSRIVRTCRTLAPEGINDRDKYQNSGDLFFGQLSGDVRMHCRDRVNYCAIGVFGVN